MDELHSVVAALTPDSFAEIVTAGAAVYQAAYASTESMRFSPDATAEDVAAGRSTAAIALCIQALCLGSPLSVQGAVVAIGSAYGALLGQFDNTMQSTLHALFKAQASQALAAANASRTRVFDA